MGGSTNTVLHLLAAAQEAEIDFTMSDIDKLSAKCRSCVQGGAEHAEIPPWKMCIAPAACAGHSGRAGPRRAAESRGQKRSWLTLPQTLEQYDVMGDPGRRGEENVPRRPGGHPYHQAFSQDCRWDTTG